MSIKRAMHRSLLASASVAAGVAAANAAAAEGSAAAGSAIEEILVVGEYGVDKLSSAKYPRPLVDTAQTVAVISDQLLIEQGRRTLRDSLRNVTGISLQAGEGNPPGGGDALNIRGFSARDDLYVDGLRDPGNYFRDPFNAEGIEVTKGPSSFVGGRGNVGGAVNIVSRKPVLETIIAPELSVGSDELYRATADLNVVLSDAHGAALRFNAMVHHGDEPGRDHVENERWGVAPSVAWGLDTPTSVVLSYLHQEQDDLPDFGLPNARNPSLAGSAFEGEVAPVDRENFYGYSTDYRDITVDLVTVELNHAFSDAASFATRLRYGHVENDSIMSAPRFIGAVTTLDDATLVVGNQKPRDQVDETLVNQTDLSLAFDTGSLAHTLVTGFELSREESRNQRRLDANGPATSLFDPVLEAAAPIPYNGTRAELETDVVSLYALDSIDLSPRWIFTAGVRYDWVDTTVRSFDPLGIAPGYVVDLSAEDAEPSWNTSLVYKPSPRSSVYVAYGSAFETSGRSEIVQLAGGNNNPPTTAQDFDVDPEISRGYELGAKYDAFGGRLALAGAVFQLEKTDARTPGIEPGGPAVVLDGEQRVRGFELSAVGALTDHWRIFGSYTWLDGEVTKSNNAFEEGQDLDNTPEHSLSVWTAYTITDRLTVGGGVQFVDERTSNVQSSPTANIPITVDAYTVVDAFVEYRPSAAVAARLNAYNLTDEEYYQAFSSGQSIPSPAQSVALTLEFEL